MPFVTADVTCTGVYVEDIVTISMPWKIITNITVYEPAKLSQHPECFGSVGIMRGGVAFVNVVSMVNSGMFGNSALLGWNGEIRTDAGCYVYGDLYGYNPQVYRLCVTYEDMGHV
jgi:hypothetical protein